MRTTVVRFASIMLASMLAITACGDDSSTDAQSQFNEFEANQVLNAAATVIESVDPVAAGVAAAVEDVDVSVECNVGGTARVVGTRDTGTAIDLEARVTYTSCASVSLTLNGIIDVTAVSSAPSAGVVKVTWTFLGTVTSRKDGINRSCTMDVTRIRTITNGTSAYTVSGNLCNRTM